MFYYNHMNSIYNVCRANGNDLELGQLKFFLNLCQLLRDVNEEFVQMSSLSTNIAIVENLAVI